MRKQRAWGPRALAARVAKRDIDRMVNAKRSSVTRPDRKGEILRAATELVAEGGLTAWSIEECARRAHCAKGLVLHYFKSKDALLAETAAALLAERRTKWAAA